MEKLLQSAPGWFFGIALLLISSLGLYLAISGIDSHLPVPVFHL